uniref:subtilisin n=1 Tax=Odontella aurita TaxID=265563 RepID=A0A7S4JZ64_9STRA|mmetsp:Transcript_57712/g.172207  ORF Transcript_57712/g.172207 Transcript_57712/m.172207 type:complete len:387 (+) Transcript_57712:2-1162(+)
MAAPVVAGSVALILQYFQEGWYPCGAKNCGSAITPSGSLLKAVIMNGAQDLEGKVKRDGKTAKNVKLRSYDNKQGMGRIDLLSSLPIAGENSINTLVVNNREIADGQVESIVVESTCSNLLLSVTVAWYDPKGMQSCKQCLINDLDLLIIRERIAAGKRVDRPVYFPNGKKQPDKKNNVERIQVSDAKESETYRIQVSANNLAKPGKQKYSLVTTGCFRIVDEQGDSEGSSQDRTSTSDNAENSSSDYNPSNGEHKATSQPSKQQTLINLKDSRVKLFLAENKYDTAPKRCEWLSKDDSRRKKFCSKEDGINNIVDAACPETCRKYNSNAQCNDTGLSLGRTGYGEEMTCAWLRSNRKEWKKCGKSGDKRNKKADVICPMTCGWCG